MLNALLALALATAHPDTMPAAARVAEYPRLVHLEEVKEPDHTGYTLAYDTLPSGDVLAPLVNRNERYFSYLAQHAPTPELAVLIPQRSWQIDALRAAYDSLLRHDPVYTAAMTGTVGRFLASGGRPLAGYDPARPLPVLRMDDVVQVAVRFFYPDAVKPDGTIQTHICVSLNGVRDLQRPRDLPLEAFLFDAIFEGMDEGTPLHGEWQRISAEMSRADLSSDATVRITRAQGFAWSRLASNPVLRETIRAAYQQRRDFLPFVIEGS